MLGKGKSLLRRTLHWQVVVGSICCLLLVSLIVVGCGGGGGGTPSIPSGTFTAKIDGKVFNARLAYFTLNEDHVVVMGFTNDGRGIEIDFDIPSSLPKTYILASEDADGFVTIMPNVNDPNTWEEYFALDNSGTVTITALTANNCQGTFSFKAKDEDTGKVITVTDGKFNVPKSPD